MLWVDSHGYPCHCGCCRLWLVVVVALVVQLWKVSSAHWLMAVGLLCLGALAVVVLALPPSLDCSALAVVVGVTVAKRMPLRAVPPGPRCCFPRSPVWLLCIDQGLGGLDRVVVLAGLVVLCLQGVGDGGMVSVLELLVGWCLEIVLKCGGL